MSPIVLGYYTIAMLEEATRLHRLLRRIKCSDATHCDRFTEDAIFVFGVGEHDQHPTTDKPLPRRRALVSVLCNHAA